MYDVSPGMQHDGNCMWSRNCLPLWRTWVHSRCLVGFVLLELRTFIQFMSASYTCMNFWKEAFNPIVQRITHVIPRGTGGNAQGPNLQSCSVHPRVTERWTLSMGDYRVIIQRRSHSMHALCVVIPRIFFNLHNLFDTCKKYRFKCNTLTICQMYVCISVGENVIGIFMECVYIQET